jgi:osmotically inducible lipoprotein OsmB
VVVKKLAVICLLVLTLAGCSNLSRQEQRALSGGALGAVAGLAITAATGGSLLVGGLVGGAGGAAIGANTK